MKIESSSKPTGHLPLKESAGAPVRKASSSGGDRVELSPLSAQLLSHDEEYAFDAGKVTEIKQAIAEGRFSINAGAIADRLIFSAKELINAQRQA